MQIRHSSAGSTLLLAGAAALVGAAWKADARRRNRRAALIHRTMVELLLNTLCAGDPVTARHSRRVADLTDALAHTYNPSREGRARLRVASLLHDLGKLDDRVFAVVHSSHRLSSSDRQQINQHPHEGADILEPLEALHPGITLIVESHHERWDGEGYPRGLRGEEIPLEARLITVADTFDALTQARRYKKGWGVEDALEEIRKEAGSRFDPEVVRRMDLPEVLEQWRLIADNGKRQEAEVAEHPEPEPESAESAS